MSKITLNIVEPGSSTPIDPVVPNTGLFTHGIGGPEATIITVSIVAIIAIVAAVLYYKKKHSKDNTANKVDKAGKATKLAETIGTLKTKKKVSIPLAALALVISLGTLTALLVNAGKSNTSAAEGGLTVTTTGEEKTIEVGDSPVFAIAEVEVTVAEETQAGYTLTAFAEDTNLVSTTDNTNIIPMVAADEGELVALAEDTYGLSLTKPASQDDEVYTALSTNQDTPTVVKTIDDYSETPANDKTTIYYGFYITPDAPKGTYEGSEIYYKATANRTDLATVTFDGNGLTFKDKETNIVRYEETITSNTEEYSHTPNITDAGVQTGNVGYKGRDVVDEVITIPGAANVHIELTYGGGLVYGFYEGGWASLWQGSHPNYTAQSDYGNDDSIKNCGGGDVTNGKYSGGDTNTTVECDITGDSVTFAYYSQGGGPGNGPTYGYYAIVTGYDADGNIIYLEGYEPFIGEYKDPNYMESETFLGWSTDPNATSAEYTTEYEITKYLLPTAGSHTTLYAVWSPIVDISYDGNNATAGSMESTSYDGDIPTTVTLAHEDVMIGNNINLYAPNYKKTGYGFAGWSTDQDAWNNLTDDDESNDLVIYGPNQSFTMTKDIAIEAAEGKDTLYAVWAPAETDNSGNPISLQDWQGCSALTPTTYDTETGQLTVGKNTITALTDNRDGEVYTVARLADGNCWMTENLRLDNESTISTNNTNNPLTVEGNVAIKNNDGNNYNHLSPNSRSWCTDWDSAACYDQSYLNAFNTNLGSEGAIASYNGGYDENKAFQWQSYGNNYNWYSATAGNGVRETTSTVAGDICPAGWMLPIGNETTANGSFSHLDTSMGGTGNYHSGSNNWRSFPNNFVYSGYWGGSSAYSRGYGGYYWSSTAYDTGGAYSLYFYSGYVDSGTYNNGKSNGFSVRCVAPVQ